jgi:MerR family transcriptional regulator/heat shock protein HspR
VNPREEAGYRLSWLEFELEPEPDSEPRYAPAAAAARIGIRIQTIRRWEDEGLIEPRRGERAALYSEADLAQLARIRRLTDDLGVNLAGVAAVLHLRRQVVLLQREMAALRRAGSDR